MVIGIIGDVHGDLAGLEWAISAVGPVDVLVCVGDVVDGPRDSACIALLRSSGAIVLQGNHDFWATRSPASSLSQDELEWLSGLPRSYEVGAWAACHSLYDSDADEVYWEDLSGSVAVKKAFEQTCHPVVFCGHTHVACVNILTNSSIEYLSTAALRSKPSFRVEQQRRYLINAGQPSYCVVIYREATGRNPVVEFVFRDTR